MKLSDVVRGVEEKDIQAFENTTADGWNDLASAEVVVDIYKIAELLDKKNVVQHIESNNSYWGGKLGLIPIAQAIATAIESGSIISLKEGGE